MELDYWAYVFYLDIFNLWRYKKRVRDKTKNMSENEKLGGVKL